MVTTYTYRNGVAPTAVNADQEITREVSLSAQTRLTGKSFSKIRELRAAMGWASDTTSDQYVGVVSFIGSGVVGSRQRFAVYGQGDVTTTVTHFGYINQAKPKLVDVQSTGQGDVAFDVLQDGDTVATGFQGIGAKYS